MQAIQLGDRASRISCLSGRPEAYRKGGGKAAERESLRKGTAEPRTPMKYYFKASYSF